MSSVAEGLATVFRQNGYALRRLGMPDGGEALVGSKHRVQRWASYVSHIAIVAILTGAMMKSLFGFETLLPVLEGRSSLVTSRLLEDLQQEPAPRVWPRYARWLSILEWPRALKKRALLHSLQPLKGWEMFVDKLTVDFYLNSTTPSTFASKVHLLDGWSVLADTTIRVNQPLDVRHIRFYQASWGVTGMVRRAVLDVAGKRYTLGMKETFPIPGQPLTGQISHYLPDFTISPDGEPSTASLEWKNPALVIGVLNKEKAQIATMAVSAPGPTTPKDAKPWALFFFQGDHIPVRPPADVVSVDPFLFSGIQVSYDPGFLVIVGGVVSMLLGLCALFYLHQRRVLVFLHSSQNGQTLVEAGGWSSRGGQEFESEFKALFQRLASDGEASKDHAVLSGLS